MYRNVIVAGTFDSLHEGHKALIRKALSSGRKVIIGLCSDEFAASRKPHPIRPYSSRKRSIIRFLGKDVDRVEIRKIEDRFGFAVEEEDLDAIIVSTETVSTADEINDIRRRKGMRQLKVIEMPIIYAEDLRKIASERIRAGKITKSGRLASPVIIAVGSENPSKLSGVRSVARRIFHKVRIRGVKVDSEVPEQPFEKQTLSGAINRAMSAWSKGADYGVGLESGLFRVYGRYFDVQWCAVYDGNNITLGHSMGFECPQGLVEEMRNKKVDMNYIFSKLTGIKEIGKKKGAIGFLSKGLAKRKEMTEQAFLCAMIPRLNLAYYSRQKPYK